MARPYGGGFPRLDAPRMKDLESFKFVEARVNGGMITTIDSADIPNSALQKAKNVRIRLDKTETRPGTILLEPVKPDSNRVLGLFLFKDKGGLSYTFRFTKSGIFIRNISEWTAVTGTLTGGDGDRFRFASVLDSAIFSNNGVEPLQTIDTTALTFGNLGNAPRYRYVTGFFNRVVGAARRGSSEVEVGWSGDNNVTEWDPAVDESAGSSPIIESSSDLSDFISGIFGFTNVMILMREQSIWLATKQPIAQNPFNFYSAVPGIGCDAPNSIATAMGGIVWFDRRTGSVWFYTPGGQPERIGKPIDNKLVDGIDDPGIIYGSFASIPNEYTVGVPRVGTDLVSTYTFNFETKAWVYDEMYGITSINDTPVPSAITTIDQLFGTIDGLIPTIDELSPAQAIIPTRVYGRNDGEILQELETSISDPIHSSQPAGTDVFEVELWSKTFTLPEVDMYFAEIVIEYKALDGGVFRLEYSKSGGDAGDALASDPNADGDWVTAKTITPTKLNVPQLIRFVRQIKARRFAFRLFGKGSRFQILSYEIHAYPSGKSKE